MMLASVLPDQPFAHPVQRLQVKLIGGLGGDEFHRRALHSLGNRFRVAEIVLLPFAIRADIFCRHQSGIVTVGLQLAAQVMGADTGFHANQARRHCGEPCFDLAARPLLRSTIAPRRSWPTTWNEFLPISMPMVATVAVDLLDMAVLHLTLAPSQHHSPSGAGARPDHSISGPPGKAPPPCR